jgi:hypothetical protein
MTRTIVTRHRLPLGDAAALAIAALVPLAAGCGDAGAPAGATAADGPMLVPSVEDVYRIGSVEGASWESFSRVVAAGFDATGNLHLLDAGNRTVTVVDGSGGLVRTTGRAGEGPGEHRVPVAMAVLPDGRVVVSDAGHRALQLFDADGVFVRAIPMGDGVMPPVELYPHGDDAVVFMERRMAMMGGMGARAGGPGRPGGAAGAGPAGEESAAILRLSLASPVAAPEAVTTVWLPPREAPQVSSSGGATMVRRPLRAFDPRVHLAILPDGAMAVADTTAYRIRLVAPGEAEDRVLDRPVAPVAVTARERELERERRLEELASGGGPTQGTVMGMAGGQAAVQAPPRSMLEAQLESMTFWPEIQVVQRLAADRDGRLWVQRFGDIGEPGPIDILGPDGSTLATIPAGALPIPAAFGPGGLAAWVERDDLDVPFVRVGRLTVGGG